MCGQPSWSCGPETAASFLCDAPVSGFYYQLYRQTAAGFQPVQTTVQSTGDPSSVGETEFGYIPSPSETSLTYRVCKMYQTSPGTPKVCGQPILVPGTTLDKCVCHPTTCGTQLACNRAISDGCGGTLQCGACTNGIDCNNGNCCPPGQEPDGTGGCVCAPPHPCRRGTDWDPNLCVCAPPR